MAFVEVKKLVKNYGEFCAVDNLSFVVEEGEIFGYYMNTEVIEKYYEYQETDLKSFHFNLQTKGRINKPMKYEIKNLKKGGIVFWKKSDDNLIDLGDIYLMKENRKNESFCDQNEDEFDYEGIPNALCGKTLYEDENEEWKGERFCPIRIKVIQMIN